MNDKEKKKNLRNMKCVLSYEIDFRPDINSVLTNYSEQSNSVIAIDAARRVFK